MKISFGNGFSADKNEQPFRIFIGKCLRTFLFLIRSDFAGRKTEDQSDCDQYPNSFAMFHGSKSHPTKLLHYRKTRRSRGKERSAFSFREKEIRLLKLKADRL